MKIIKESHLDHGLSDDQVEWLKEKFADRVAFFIETVEFPEELGTVPCGLHGPAMGDASIADGETYLAKRNVRAWTSRMTWRYPRQTRLVTVIAGPNAEPCEACHGLGFVLGSHQCLVCEKGKIMEPCVLYTCYGGPQAPQEPGDPGCRDKAASEAFWAEHALSGSLRNGTPHELIIHLEDGRIVKLPPTGRVPRVTVEYHDGGVVGGVKVRTASFGKVVGLPVGEMGIDWIVSSMVLDAARSRADVFAPGEPVRDADGKIVGCLGIRR